LSIGLRVIGKKAKFLFGVLWNFGVRYRMYSAERTKPAVEGECAPLLTTKYEPDLIETDGDIEVGNRKDKKHVKNTFFRVLGVSTTLRL